MMSEEDYVLYKIETVYDNGSIVRGTPEDILKWCLKKLKGRLTVRLTLDPLKEDK